MANNKFGVHLKAAYPNIKRIRSRQYGRIYKGVQLSEAGEAQCREIDRAKKAERKGSKGG
jgi:hypothetical protein